MNRRISARLLPVVAALALVLPLAACSSDTGPAGSFNDGSNKGFVSGNGAATTIPPSERTAPVEFSGASDQGGTFGSDDTLGSVTVVNFWYAGCAPCRTEAPDLVAAYDEFTPKGVKFVGVNTRDQLAQAQQFAEEFKIPYPSIMDNQNDRAVQRAFAGQVPLNAVPTTVVLDKQGRVAHRVVGQLPAESSLRSLIDETLAEG